MRATIAAALTLAALTLRPAGALAQPVSTLSELADETLAATLWQIAVSTGTPIGFESIEPMTSTAGALHDVLFPHPPEVRRISVPSLENAVDAAIAANPRYEWRRVGSVVVVRPLGAWADTRDPLNLAVQHFRAERSTDIEILSGICSLIKTGQYIEHREGTTVVPSFVLESGTVVDVLNRLIESAQLPFWQAGYRLHSPQELNMRADLSLILLTATGLPTEASRRIRSAAQN